MKGDFFMNILVTLNSDYVRPLRAMLASLIAAEKEEELKIYMLHSALTEFDLSLIHRTLENSSAELIEVRVPKGLGSGGYHFKRLSEEAYYRLFAPWLLPKDVEKILYLDPDITVLNSVRELYETDLSGKCIAGASHMFSPIQEIICTRLKMAKNSQYINSGVMLMNLPEMRKTISPEEISAYIRKMGKRLYQADQDVVNALYSRKTVYVESKKFNLDEKYFRNYNRDPRIKDKLDLPWVKAHTSIIHFCGKNKPWLDGYKGDFGEFFRPFDCLPAQYEARRNFSEMLFGDAAV